MDIAQFKALSAVLHHERDSTIEQLKAELQREKAAHKRTRDEYYTFGKELAQIAYENNAQQQQLAQRLTQLEGQHQLREEQTQMMRLLLKEKDSTIEQLKRKRARIE